MSACGRLGSTQGSSISACLPQKPRRRLLLGRAAGQAVSQETADQASASEEEEGLPGSGDDGQSPPGATAGGGAQPELASRLMEAIEGGDRAALDRALQELGELQKEQESLSSQVASLDADVAAGKDRFLRLNADFDNFRKRSEREKQEIAARVKADVVEELLPMVDNFERAKTSIRAETDGERRIDGSYQGIYKQFVEAMRGLGVAAIETVGKEFDPNVHEAIMREESAEVPEGFVTQEFRRGFMFGDKLLRPAMVKVSAGSGAGSDGTAVPGADSAEDVSTPQQVESTG